MRIELLYFDGCPNHETLVPRLRELLDRAGVREEVRLVRVESPDAAERDRFLGSPTLRIDGQDVEPGADERSDYGLKCRLYRTSAGLAGVPAEEWILEALATAAGRGSTALQQLDDAQSDLDGVAWRSWASRRLARLSSAERRLHRRILRSMAAGREVAASVLADWASDEGADAGAVLEALEAHDLALRDPGSGAVTVAYPFSARPTAHRVTVAGAAGVYAMCALDALGVGFMTGQAVDVRSTDPATGEEVEISVDPSGTAEWRPADAAVVLACVGSGASADCLCPHTNFAVSRASGEAQLDALGGCSGSVLSMPEAIEAARETFGALLAPDQEVTHAPADRA
jgi:hypothetical protein